MNSNEKPSRCGGEMEVWARVTGYMQPVHKFNPGKGEEFKDRKMYTVFTANKASHPTGDQKPYDTTTKEDSLHETTSDRV
jgi:hypothetical protein